MAVDSKIIKEGTMGHSRNHIPLYTYLIKHPYTSPTEEIGSEPLPLTYPLQMS
jgi:hypothetical protein